MKEDLREDLKQDFHNKELEIIKDMHEKESELIKDIHERELELVENFKEEEETIKRSLKAMYSITEDAASNKEIRNRLLSAGKITGTNMVVMICAILIASVGLNTNSIAVIIGAMLISPLMGSLLAIAYGTASNNSFIIEKHIIGFVIQVVISITTAALYFRLSPVKGVTEQLLARTQPRFFDVIVAIAGGVAGIVGQTRKDKANNIIPGVAIATALMPPLCTCGYAIANGKIRMLGGAFYLFIINAYLIYASADVVLAILRTPHVKEMTDVEWHEKRRKMARNTIVILIPILIIAILGYNK